MFLSVADNPTNASTVGVEAARGITVSTTGRLCQREHLVPADRKTLGRSWRQPSGSAVSTPWSRRRGSRTRFHRADRFPLAGLRARGVERRICCPTGPCWRVWTLGACYEDASVPGSNSDRSPPRQAERGRGRLGDRKCGCDRATLNCPSPVDGSHVSLGGSVEPARSVAMAVRHHGVVPHDFPGHHRRVVDLLVRLIRAALEDRDSRIPADVPFSGGEFSRSVSPSVWLRAS